MVGTGRDHSNLYLELVGGLSQRLVLGRPASLCVRALRAYGINLSRGQCWMCRVQIIGSMSSLRDVVPIWSQTCNLKSA
jgi:hypothetical protein